MNTEEEFSLTPQLDKTTLALLSLLVGGYPGVKLTRPNEYVYGSTLQRFDPREAQSAIESLIHSHPHFPRPADITQEVTRQRAERARLEENARAAAVNRRSSRLDAPTPSDWGRVLPRMLEDAARHRRMAAPHYRSKGKKVPEDPGAEMLELVQAGSRGENVLERVRRAVLDQ